MTSWVPQVSLLRPGYVLHHTVTALVQTLILDKLTKGGPRGQFHDCSYGPPDRRQAGRSVPRIWNTPGGNRQLVLCRRFSILLLREKTRQALEGGERRRRSRQHGDSDTMADSRSVVYAPTLARSEGAAPASRTRTSRQPANRSPRRKLLCLLRAGFQRPQAARSWRVASLLAFGGRWLWVGHKARACTERPT